MRLRDLTPDEHGDVAVLRRRLQATHGIEAASAPFMRDWLTVPAAGGGVRLHGFCWGHPGLGDTVVTTTPVVEMTEVYARTSSGRLYLLGPEDRDHSRKRRLQGSRGPLVITAAAEPEAVPDFRR